MSPLFWQYLLAAELAPAKSRAVLATLGTSPLDPIAALRTGNLLSEAERRRLDRADLKALESALAGGATVLTEEEYPEALLAAGGVPPALFAWGDLAALEAPCIGIVGTRGASAYGRAVAQKFAEVFARSGATVVSGGALGIDAAAHKGALEAGGRTVVVLGTGIDRVFPSGHGPLYARVRERGCLLSQFAAGKPSLPENFPARNHLVAALSQAVLVVEAPASSGAILTAKAAAELGRDVFVVPASIDQTNFRGSLALIRDGATLVFHPEHVLAPLGIEAAPAPSVAPTDLSEAQRLLLEALTVEPIDAERLATRTGLAHAELLIDLTELEMEGLILRTDLGYARRP